ncbi:hypothetical protein TKK_0003922 [Trichogramma kaykai]|uniref:ATP-dependent RNA helicase n=1 Tax=Trichogramma kaykai TaxID=54128 RepID=A0ABD2XP69_9HYME
MVENMEVDQPSENATGGEAWSALGVPEEIKRNLIEQGFLTPTKIQTLAIPPAIFGKRDILGAAETGSGKTLAFGIPILDGIMKLKAKHGKIIKTASGSFKEVDMNETECDNESDEDEDNESKAEESTISDNGIGLVKVIDNVEIDGFPEKASNKPLKPLYALILTPTRELAVQIRAHLIKAAANTDIRIALVVGGMASVKQERILKQGPEIVIATPGRLWELIELGNPHLNQIESVKYLAIDETDRMLEAGHFEELHQILEKMNFKESKIQQRQTFVFSATLSLVHDIPDYLKRKKQRNSRSRIKKLTPEQKLKKVIDILKLKNPKVIDVTTKTGTTNNLTECRIVCSIEQKDYYLYYFLQRHPGRTLVFCNSIGCVKRLAQLFSILKCKPFPLHASMTQPQRLRNLERFQSTENSLLIATDVAARGLDIPNIEHVIHYQVPRTSESYVHRSGRTARAMNEGLTVLLMEPTEKHNYTKICKTLNRTEDLPTFPVVDRLLMCVKERVNVARDIDKLELTCRKENFDKSWRQKAAREMDILLDDDDADEQDSEEAKGKADAKRSLQGKKARLEALLKKPLFPKNYSGKFLDHSLELSLEQNSRRAIDVMKDEIKKPNSKGKKRPLKLYRPDPKKPKLEETKTKKK